MDRTTQLISASVLLATLAMALLQAPVVPVVIGAAGAGLLLYLRLRRRRAVP